MSDETEYTKGPWDWTIHDHSCASLGTGDDPGMGDPLVMSVSPCRSCIDRVKDGEWVWGRCTTPSEADARLIAAAPELLEALMAVEMARHTDAKDDWLKATALTEAAIVKATVRPK